MKKGIGILMVFVMMVSMTSCRKDVDIDEDTSEIDGKELVEEIEEENLTVEEILEFVVDRKDERENYSLEYDGDYYCKTKAIDLSDEDLEDLGLSQLEEGKEINQRDEVYHYQDGKGKFKTILYRFEDGERKENIIAYDRKKYIIYDSEMAGEDASLDDVWSNLDLEGYQNNLPGLLLLDSDEEIEEVLAYENINYPENPLKDMASLLEIYKYSDMYRVKRLIDDEDDETYVLNLLSYEEDVDILFFVDKEDFYIKSYEGHNGDAEFSGKVKRLEEYLDYELEFFSEPSIL